MQLPLTGAIDCDFHPVLTGTEELLPYLDDFWQDSVRGRRINHLELTSYPPNAPLTARPDWGDEDVRAGSDPERMRAHVLDRYELGGAIGNCLYGAAAVYSDSMAAALCSAVNDWMAAEWLSRDNRLRASINISLMEPAAAVEEIERLSGDNRFVQVLVFAMGEMPLGRRVYWPIYEAAERYGLPIAVHAGSEFRHSQTPTGYPSYLVEDYVAQNQGFMAQVMSLIANGVFTKFPALKVVLAESGVSWLPALMWRASKDWRSMRAEIPWVKDSPADVIRRHIRVTMQPFDVPPGFAGIERLVEHLGSEEMFLFSTDYPHWQFDGDDVLPDGLPEEFVRRALIDNPLETYPRLSEARHVG